MAVNEQEVTPAVVSVYAATKGLPECVARFRWSAEAGVTLEIFEEEWGRLAIRYYENGIPDRADGHMVTRADGAAFMAALTRVRSGSYCAFVAE